MNIKNYRFAILLGLTISLAACNANNGGSSSQNGSSGSESSETSSETSSSSSSSSDPQAAYYASITDNMTGTALLSALRSLNSQKRTRTVGYDNMGDYYKQTDGDPSNSSNLIGFYSGTSKYFDGKFYSSGADKFNR